jgi:hypothetical protein
MSYRPNGLFVPNSRGSSTCTRYTAGGEMSARSLEQRIYIKFCVEIGGGASEMLALLILAYGGYAMEKSSVLE